MPVVAQSPGSIVTVDQLVVDDAGCRRGALPADACPATQSGAGERQAGRARAGTHGLRDVAGPRIEPDDRPAGLVRDPDRVAARGDRDRARARPWTVAVTCVRWSGSIRETVPSSVLATQTAPAPKASAVGPLPTPIVCVTVVRDFGSTRTTPVLGAVADPDRARADGDAAPGGADVDRLDAAVLAGRCARRSRRRRSSPTPTRRRTPRRSGLFPTRIGSPTTSFASGSIRETVPARRVRDPDVAGAEGDTRQARRRRGSSARSSMRVARRCGRRCSPSELVTQIASAPAATRVRRRHVGDLVVDRAGRRVDDADRVRAQRRQRAAARAAAAEGEDGDRDGRGERRRRTRRSTSGRR